MEFIQPGISLISNNKAKGLHIKQTLIGELSGHLSRSRNRATRTDICCVRFDIF